MTRVRVKVKVKVTAASAERPTSVVSGDPTRRAGGLAGDVLRKPGQQ